MRANMAPKVLSGAQNLTTRSERIIEEAYFSGEILLCGRKLKDFPKVAGKAGAVHSLEDTVFAGKEETQARNGPSRRCIDFLIIIRGTY